MLQREGRLCHRLGRKECEGGGKSVSPDKAVQLYHDRRKERGYVVPINITPLWNLFELVVWGFALAIAQEIDKRDANHGAVFAKRAAQGEELN